MNLRPLPPQGSALPSCATSRNFIQLSTFVLFLCFRNLRTPTASLWGPCYVPKFYSIINFCFVSSLSGWYGLRTWHKLNASACVLRTPLPSSSLIKLSLNSLDSGAHPHRSALGSLLCPEIAPERVLLCKTLTSLS